VEKAWLWLNARGKVWPVQATYTYKDGTTEVYVESVFLRRKSAEKHVRDFDQLVQETGMSSNKKLELGEFIPFWWFA
jgi:hypothetical protein